jgi:hypothetical protein
MCGLCNEATLVQLGEKFAIKYTCNIIFSWFINDVVSVAFLIYLTWLLDAGGGVHEF